MRQEFWIPANILKVFWRLTPILPPPHQVKLKVVQTDQPVMEDKQRQVVCFPQDFCTTLGLLVSEAAV